MKLIYTLSLIFLTSHLLTTKHLQAQQFAKKTYITSENSDNEINIDGKLTDIAWSSANWENNFIQYEPIEGAEANQKTSFAILYDHNFIYVGFKAFDTSPDSIVQRMTRRDDMDGDLVAIEFDTYHDKRTAFAFIVSAAGIKTEFLISNDGDNEDDTWDPIWWVKTSHDDKGWNAEMKIPLTQLRFEESADLTWGLQVGRHVFRKEEWSLWQQASKKQSGWVSQYGELKGLKNIKPKKALDIVPYVVARTNRFEKETENPFRTSGKSNKIDAGIDGKLGITNNLTLDFTINPDFGQVEADPSEVNLSAYETFFEEKRPFFIEGKNILNFPLMFGDGDLASENLFYSRRIGRRPHYSPDLEDDEYIKSPDFTSIIGAAKVTGKTKDGWSVGLLESLTSNEFADISNGNNRTLMVEPLTNYIVSRVQKDLNEGNTLLGAMATAVNRNLNEDQLNYLHKSAYTGGIDFSHKWNNKTWEVNFSSYFSHVTGSTEAIKETQESWIHSFQRPDATHLSLDSTRTSLSGQGGKLLLSKNGGNLRFMNAIAWKSPGLDLNDVGYMRMADNIIQVFWLGYRIYEPFSIFRYYNFNFNQWTEWNFAGELTSPGGNINMHTQFKNFWRLSLGGNINGETLSTSELRGGPALKLSGYKNIWMFIKSNDQKKITTEANFFIKRSNQNNSADVNDYNFEIDFRPSKSLKLAIEPSFSKVTKELQYVTQEDISSGTDYIFARIKQKTFRTSIRINYNITPDLSIQYWGQPFFSTGKYDEFKRITDGRANTYTNRFSMLSTDEINYTETDETYHISNINGDKLFEFETPDFNVKEFLSNMVVRWEYTPGSTLYLVWSQNREHSGTNGGFNLSKNFNYLFDEKPENIFLIKLSYRIGR